MQAKLNASFLWTFIFTTLIIQKTTEINND
ncbi:hypothetical protein VPH209E381_0086 [Vibrio phage 209E38-1]